MSPFEAQLKDLQTLRDAKGAEAIAIPNGGQVVRIPDFELPVGWVLPNGAAGRKATILFLAPPGYPASKPDCFWVQPSGLRLTDNRTPQNTADTNPIPGYTAAQPHGTWFSWHVQSWNPNTDSLVTYFNVIKNRLNPPR